MKISFAVKLLSTCRFRRCCLSLLLSLLAIGCSSSPPAPSGPSPPIGEQDSVPAEELEGTWTFTETRITEDVPWLFVDESTGTFRVTREFDGDWDRDGRLVISGTGMTKSFDRIDPRTHVFSGFLHREETVCPGSTQLASVTTEISGWVSESGQFRLDSKPPMPATNTVTETCHVTRIEPGQPITEDVVYTYTKDHEWSTTAWGTSIWDIDLRPTTYTEQEHDTVITVTLAKVQDDPPRCVVHDVQWCTNIEFPNMTYEDWLELPYRAREVCVEGIGEHDSEGRRLVNEGAAWSYAGVCWGSDESGETTSYYDLTVHCEYCRPLPVAFNWLGVRSLEGKMGAGYSCDAAEVRGDIE